jgi:hypothetical protein
MATPKKPGRLSGILSRALPLPFALAAWGAVYQYSPDFAFTDDVLAKYLLVSAIALAVGLGCWAVLAEISKRAALADVAAALKSPPVDLDTVSREIASAHIDQAGGASGWCHYLGSYSQPQSPSALSSAYALRSLMNAGYRASDVNVHATCEWILSKANSDGGWSAQSQRGISRLEVTSFVAGTLARLHGRGVRVVAAVEYVETTIRDSTDPLAQSDTYVVSSVLQEAAHLGLHPTTSTLLVERLLDGAVQSGDEKFYWAESLRQHNRGGASTATTAHAVLALQAYERLELTVPHSFRATLTGAIEWLASAPLADEVTKLVRYPAPGVEEVNAPRHFTSALVALALSQAGLSASSGTQRALQESWTRYRGGLWIWHSSGDAPTYSTYYGLAAAMAARLT